MLTTAGKQHILRFMAGYNGAIGQVLSVGSGSQAAALTDTRLNFECARAEITTVAPDFINGRIVFKALLDADVVGTFTEAGIWSAAEPATEAGSKLISSFDSTEGWTGSGTFIVSTARIGGDSLRLAPIASGTVTQNLSDVALDLSEYSNVDVLSLAFSITTLANVSSVKLRLLVDSTNYYEYTATGLVAGYQVKSFNKTNFTSTGSPSWDNIAQIEVSVVASASGAAQVDFDGLRIDENDATDPESILVARSVLSTPIAKAGDGPQEFEYALPVTL